MLTVCCNLCCFYSIFLCLKHWDGNQKVLIPSPRPHLSYLDQGPECTPLTLGVSLPEGLHKEREASWKTILLCFPLCCKNLTFAILNNPLLCCPYVTFIASDLHTRILQELSMQIPHNQLLYLLHLRLFHSQLHTHKASTEDHKPQQLFRSRNSCSNWNRFSLSLQGKLSVHCSH